MLAAALEIFFPFNWVIFSTSADKNIDGICEDVMKSAFNIGILLMYIHIYLKVRKDVIQEKIIQEGHPTSNTIKTQFFYREEVGEMLKIYRYCQKYF